MRARDRANKYINVKKHLIEIRSPRVFFWGKRIELVLGLLKKLKNLEIRRHFGVSHSVYQAYDDWEMRAYEQGSTWTLDHDRMNRVSFVDIRNYYLAPIIAEVEARHAADPSRPVDVLEVGCGNGTNLMVLARDLGNKVRLRGIDIYPERLKYGRAYWGGRLNGVKMVEDSATSLTTQGDRSADVVFSLHCLEQIPYAVDDCLKSMARITRDRVVLVEPVWEYANLTQKMYTLFGDQLRTLLPSIPLCGLEIVSQRRAEVIANPLNQTGIIVARKA
jgi:ubiquinone/menaquinone biosynthesis C-methylase UbiE